MEELIGIASYHRGLGDVALLLDDLEQAHAEYEQALAFQERDQRVHRIWGLVIIHSRLASVLLKLEAFREARQHLLTALSMAKEWHNLDIKALPLVGIASLLAASDYPAAALEIAACVTSKPTTWNETRKEARSIMEKARQGLPVDEAERCVG